MNCSICIPTYRRNNSLATCLSSIAGFMPIDSVTEILIAVTGEYADSIGYEAASIIQVLELKGAAVTVMDGFAGLLEAKRWFAEQAASDILLLLDDDAVIDDDYLDLLHHFDHADIAAVSGSLQTPLDTGHYADWSIERIAAPQQGMICNKLSIKDDLVLIDDKYQVYMLDEPRTYKCEVLVGTALFIRRDLLEVDENFAKGKFYFEEYDFTYGLYKKGYKLLYDASRIAWHIRDASGGMRSLGTRDKKVNGRYFKEKYGL